MSERTSMMPSAGVNPGGPDVAQVWVVITRLLLLAIYSQSIFAGVLLSGYGWGRTAHRITAYGLIVAMLVAGIAALATVRGVTAGTRLAVSYFALAVGLVIQMSIGQMAADGDRILWLHVPFGVFLIGMTAELVTVARRLGK